MAVVAHVFMVVDVVEIEVVVVVDVVDAVIVIVLLTHGAYLKDHVLEMHISCSQPARGLDV